MWANNEIGTVSDIAALAEVAHEVGVPLHTDAVQAVGQVPVDFAASGVDALTMTGHKLGGPMGAGALLLRRDAECTPLLHGGGQERDVRSGTLDVAAIVGLQGHVGLGREPARARGAHRGTARPARRRRARAGARCAALDDLLRAGNQAAGPGRLPGNAHLSFPGAEGDALLMLLDAAAWSARPDRRAVPASRAPATCSSRSGPTPTAPAARCVSRLGHTSTEHDVQAVLDVIGPVVERARRAGMGSR